MSDSWRWATELAGRLLAPPIRQEGICTHRSAKAPKATNAHISAIVRVIFKEIARKLLDAGLHLREIWDKPQLEGISKQNGDPG
ncbi:hypothetical protein NAP1_11523 [Erythrobacter sp. NAP1]|nr:hypothetical protein NAP1_11523 [Erythrobacter sp. NAP1]